METELNISFGFICDNISFAFTTFDIIILGKQSKVGRDKLIRSYDLDLRVQTELYFNISINIYFSLLIVCRECSIGVWCNGVWLIASTLVILVSILEYDDFWMKVTLFTIHRTSHQKATNVTITRDVVSRQLPACLELRKLSPVSSLHSSVQRCPSDGR